VDALTATQVLLGLVTGLVGLALATVLLRPLWLPIWRLFRGTQQFLEDWFGEPARPGEGVEARPGAMARLAQLEKNSGSTMHDSVRRIEQRVGAIEDQVEEVRESARQAVTAAGLAVNEAKVGRAVTAEAAERNRHNVSELRAVVSGLAGALEQDERERRLKESAYVGALNRLGVPLAPIADALDDEPGPTRGE
jgi:hypothetical protein